MIGVDNPVEVAVCAVADSRAAVVDSRLGVADSRFGMADSRFGVADSPSDQWVDKVQGPSTVVAAGRV